jgi:hypothetical protein
MGHQQAYRAAADGKHRANKTCRPDNTRFANRRLSLAAAVFVMGALWAAPGHSQSGPFAGLAGNWAGAGVITLDDGSKERIRCRAVYAVAGAKMAMTLTCASDAYRFQLSADVADQAGMVTGTWSEATRNVSGVLQGRGGGGVFEVVASTAGFNANIALRTTGNKQSIAMRADSQFQGAAISLSK